MALMESSFDSAPTYKLGIVDSIADGWNAFLKHPWLAIGGSLLLFLVLYAPEMLISQCAGDMPTLDARFLLQVLMSLIRLGLLFVLYPPIFGGLLWFYLRIARDDNPRIGDLLEGFKCYGSMLGIYWLLVLAVLVAMLPFVIVLFTSGAMSGPESELSEATIVDLLFCGLLFMVFFCFLIRYCFVYYIQFDFRQLGIFDSLGLSSRMIRGNYWRLFGLMVATGIIGFAVACFYYAGLMIVCWNEFAEHGFERIMTYPNLGVQIVSPILSVILATAYLRLSAAYNAGRPQPAYYPNLPADYPQSPPPPTPGE